MTDINLDTMMWVIGFNDYPDGDAYRAEEHEVELPYVFTTALDVLTRCDQVCITDNEHHMEHTCANFIDCAPFSINISLGQYAKPTKNKQM